MNSGTATAQATPTAGVHAAGSAPNALDVQEALSAFTTASRRVEQYYQRLEDEVRRLARDVERKNRELERKVHEKERMQAVLLSTLQSLTCGVLAVGRDGVVIVANPAACELLGRSLNEVAGRGVEEILPELPGRERLVEAVREGERLERGVEWSFEAEHGPRRTVTFEVAEAPAPYDAHLRGLVVMEDVTELRRLEHQAALQSRLEAVGQMAVNLAHEIRNPLGTIALFATSLAHELREDESLGEMARNLVAGVQSLEHVVENSLEFARRRRVSLSRIDLRRTLEEALVFIEHPRRQKEIRLDLKLFSGSENGEHEGGGAEAEGAWIAGDAEQLRQVFLNLALNALQAMEPGGTLTVALKPVADGWEVEFRDTGRGIAPEHLDRVFDPFFTTREKGSGIGLALVHRILTAHGATIDVESRPGAGTTFRLQFSQHPLLSEVDEG